MKERRKVSNIKVKVLWLSGLADIQASLCPRRFVTGERGHFYMREKESNREQTTFFIEREVFGKTINNKRNSLFFGQTSEQEEERVFSSCQQILILWNQERKVN